MSARGFSGSGNTNPGSIPVPGHFLKIFQKNLKISKKIPKKIKFQKKFKFQIKFQKNKKFQKK